MPRSKKSSGGQPADSPDQPSTEAHEAAENEGMAHIPADELAGSPDVFTRKRSKGPIPGAPAPNDEAAAHALVTSGESNADAEPAPEAPEAPPAPPEPISAMEPAPPPFAPAPPAMVTAPPPPARRGGSGIALGVVFVVIGVFYLAVQVLGIDLSSFGWPLFIIIPGLTLLIVGLVSLGTGAAIPGGILTMVGLVLAYQNSTGNWASWAYAWALVAPGGVGLGLFLQGLRERSPGLIRQGRNLMFIAALIFMVGFVFFESLLNLSGMNDQPVVRAALPALFIVIGVLLLARSIRNARQAPR